MKIKEDKLKTTVLAQTFFQNNKDKEKVIEETFYKAIMLLGFLKDEFIDPYSIINSFVTYSYIDKLFKKKTYLRLRILNPTFAEQIKWLSDSEIQCANCNEILESNLKKCSRCKLKYYCSRKCQTKHWKKHKIKCKK